MKKKLLAIILTATMCFSIIPVSAANATDAQNKAQALKTLDLFKGVSDTDFELDRAPTRTEAIVMFLRIMGAEDAALAQAQSHPFTDVPSWADDYIGYAYKYGYTNGVSATKFGSEETADAATYLTFMLRALCYSDSSGGQFTWDNPYDLATQIGILTSDVNTQYFTRGDAAVISWNTLFVPMNGGNKDVCDIFIMSGLFTSDDMDNAIKIANGESSSSATASIVDGVKIGEYTCPTDSFGFVYSTEYIPTITINADYTFSISVNTGYGMEHGYGTWSTYATDYGSTMVKLAITSPTWFEETPYPYSFEMYSTGTLFKTDGGIGITPVESAFIN